MINVTHLTGYERLDWEKEFAVCATERTCSDSLKDGVRGRHTDTTEFCCQAPGGQEDTDTLTKEMGTDFISSISHRDRYLGTISDDKMRSFVPSAIGLLNKL